MQPLMTIDDLSKLTDAELLRVDAALCELVFSPSLGTDDLQRVLASLTNAAFVRAGRAITLKL